MKHLTPSEYPIDLTYHRTTSPDYRTYLEGCGVTTYDIGQPPFFAWKKGLFGNRWYITKYERTNVEPDIDFLRHTVGIPRGVAIWIPLDPSVVPSGWRSLWASGHFQETGFTTLSHDYEKKWNSRARRAKKRFLDSGAKIELVDPETFITAFRRTRVKHWFKSDYITYYQKMLRVNPDSLRSWLCYDPSGKPVAGLAVHDYGNTSVHLVAFTGRDAYPIQAGTGLIDTWFLDSYEKGFQYISFDQLRQKGGPPDQKGYTAFKENFIEYRMSYPKAYFRFF